MRILIVDRCGQRNVQGNCSALVACRECDFTPESSGAVPHACQPVTVNGGRWFKPHAAVVHLYNQALAFNANVDIDASALGMASDVVDAFLKDEEYLPPRI